MYKMEALVFDGKTLTLKHELNYPMPKIVKDNEVIVKVAYSGVCGTDLHILQGEFPVIQERPLILGHEFSGTIAEAGKESYFKKGQRVVVDPNRPCSNCEYCRTGKYQHCLSPGVKTNVGTWKDGGWAQYMVIPQEQVFALPDNVTLEQAGLTEPYSCVAQGYKRASPLEVGAKILISGAGIIGNLWVTSLHHQGHRDVTVSEVNTSRLETVKRLDTGYRLVTPDVLESEKEEVKFDVIIDCTGVGKVMEINFHYLKPGGKYVLFGCCPPTHQAALNPFDIYNKELTIIGVKINPYTFPTSIKWISAMGERYLNYQSLGVKTYKLSEYDSALKDLKIGSISKAIFKVE